MQPSILCSFLILFLWACGTQDYSEWDDPAHEREAEAEVVEGPEISWRERALAAEFDAPNLIPPHGNSATGCPSNTLCIEGSYMSGHQWRDLASRYPGHVNLQEKDGGVTVRVEGSSRVLIESDLFHLGSDRLVLCGKENIISVSGFEGGGLIDTSAASCGGKDAGDVVLISHEFESHPKILANGLDGHPGIDAVVPKGEERAASGNPKAARIQIDVNYLKGRWPLTKAAADGVKENGSDAALRKLRTLAQMGLYSEQILEEHLNKNCQGCSKGADRWYKSPHAGCFFYFQNDGLFNWATPKVVGVEGLDGKPANPEKVWRGDDGEDGGNAGKVTVLSSHLGKSFSGEIKSLPGEGGPGGMGAHQLPGLGVSPGIDPVSQRINDKHWVSCVVRKGNRYIEVADWTSPTVRTIDLNFSLNGPASYDRFGQSSGRLQVRSGKDGAAISKEIRDSLKGKPGEPGQAHEPEVHLVPVEDFVHKFEEICSDCLPLTIIEEEILNSTKGNDHD